MNNSKVTTPPRQLPLSVSSGGKLDSNADGDAVPPMLDSDFFARYGIEPSSPGMDSPLPKPLQGRLFANGKQHSDVAANSGGSALFSSPVDDYEKDKSASLLTEKQPSTPAVRLTSPILSTFASSSRITKRHITTVPRRPVKLGPPARSLRQERKDEYEEEEDELPSSSFVTDSNKRISNASQLYDESHTASLHVEQSVNSSKPDIYSFGTMNHASVKSNEDILNNRPNTRLSQSFREISDAIQSTHPITTSYQMPPSSGKSTESVTFEAQSTMKPKAISPTTDIVEQPLNSTISHELSRRSSTDKQPVLHSRQLNHHEQQQQHEVNHPLNPLVENPFILNQSKTNYPTNPMADALVKPKSNLVPVTEPDPVKLHTVLETPIATKTPATDANVPVSNNNNNNTPMPLVIASNTTKANLNANVTNGTANITNPTITNTAANTAANAATTAAVASNNSTFTINTRTFSRISVIGKGGSSKVFKVMAPNNRIFALKRVTLRKADQATIEGYLNEINLLKRLANQEYIIKLADWEYDTERKLMECGDIDLDGILKKQHDKPISMNFILLYWEQMLQAVETIHEEKIVHSDLKPANFLLVGGTLKLIDFGIAKAIGNDTTNIHRDQHIGTLNYMSPEAFQDTNTSVRPGQPHQQLMKLGRASDVWSLGCILYQMVYGYTPFSHLNIMQKLQCYITSSRSRTIPVDPELIRVLKSCLIRNPKERATIPQLLADPILRRQGVSLVSKSIYPTLTPDLMNTIVKTVIDYHKRHPKRFDSPQGIDELSQASY
ncbi:kinase-like domain-containing protein [Syncephalis fuscata]|nr:kinase-like domain-containing protein [Syncephalis fuscata]